MKISTRWTQKDWDDALNKVWELSRDFEEILEFGLEHGYITSSDIIHASDIYKDPNKEYDDDEIKAIISSRGIRDILGIIQEEYSLDEIVDELDIDEVLDNVDKGYLLDKLDGSFELDSHDEDVREEYRDEVYEEIMSDLKEDKDIREVISESSVDELHHIICDVIGCGYYDQEGINKGLKKLKEKLNQNIYGIKY